MYVVITHTETDNRFSLTKWILNVVMAQQVAQTPTFFIN